jgi:hypothetical protein
MKILMLLVILVSLNVYAKSQDEMYIESIEQNEAIILKQKQMYEVKLLELHRRNAPKSVIEKEAQNLRNQELALEKFAQDKKVIQDRIKADRLAKTNAAKEKISKVFEKPKAVLGKITDTVKDGASYVGDKAGTLVEKGKEVIEKEKKAKELREDTKNYKPETCVWSQDIPRRIIKAPSCGRTPMKICTGYVVCDQKAEGSSAKFVRMTTCSSELCGEEDAVACTKDPGYSSVKADEEESNTVSYKIRKKIESGASEQ